MRKRKAAGRTNCEPTAAQTLPVGPPRPRRPPPRDATGTHRPSLPEPLRDFLRAISGATLQPPTQWIRAKPKPADIVHEGVKLANDATAARENRTGHSRDQGPRCAGARLQAVAGMQRHVPVRSRSAELRVRAGGENASQAARGVTDTRSCARQRPIADPPSPMRPSPQIRSARRASRSRRDRSPCRWHSSTRTR